jgi:hypothetical protein
MLRTAAILAALGLAGAAPPPSVEPPTPVEGVEVEGRPKADAAIRDQVHAYVAGVLARNGEETLLRWREPLCPLVAGLPQDQGEYMLARITLIARNAGAKLAPRRCTPNFYVVVTGEPEALLKAWRKRDGALFGRQAPAKVGRFLGQDRPVRVWHNWDFAPADGSSPTEYSPTGAPTINHPKDSRLVTNAVRGAWGVVAVVDAARLQGMSVAQLSDYIALTGLAELNPDAQPGAAPSILRLFDGPPAEAPATLSPWDQAFLAALYGSEQDNLNQRAQIAGRMLRAVTR